jgi:hypothetical protein
MAYTPNRATREAMADLEAGKGKRFDSADDLFKGLGWEVKFRRYDTADYLKTEDDIAAYLDAVRDDGDPALMEAARDDVTRARARIVDAAGTKREG